MLVMASRVSDLVKPLVLDHAIGLGVPDSRRRDRCRGSIGSQPSGSPCSPVSPSAELPPKARQEGARTTNPPPTEKYSFVASISPFSSNTVNLSPFGCAGSGFRCQVLPPLELIFPSSQVVSLPDPDSSRISPSPLPDPPLQHPEPGPSPDSVVPPRQIPDPGPSVRVRRRGASYALAQLRLETRGATL